jgi:PmbA protein
MIQHAIRIACRAGMDDVIARLEEHRDAQIKFHNNDISVIKDWHSRRLSLFMAADKKIFHLTLENPDREAVSRAITHAGDIIPLLTSKKRYHGIGRQRTSPCSEARYSADVTDTEQLVDIAHDAIDGALEQADHVAGVLSAGTEHVDLATSEDIHASDDNSRIALSIRAFKNGGSGHAVRCARTPDGLDGHAGHEAARDACRASCPRQGERGTYDVVFSSLALANIMQHVAAMASAFYVDSGMSFLADSLGQQVAREHLTIRDSGVHPGGIASRAFDGEGVATGETAIIDRGMLASFLHNTSTAREHDTETTANAGLVAPHPWNVIVAPGDASLQELISEVEHGLLVTNTWYTRFQNYRTGDFSTIPRDAAFVIDHGELGHAITAVRISDVMPRLLNGISMLGREQRQIHWWEVETPVFTPPALVRDVPVTRSFR